MNRLHPLAPVSRSRWARLADGPLWDRLAVLLGVGAISLTLLPILWMVLMSFSAQPLSGIPWPLTFAWYRALAADHRWQQPLLTSLVLAILVGVACTLGATAVARSIMRLPRPGPVLLYAAFPMALPALALGAAYFIFFRSLLGLKLGYWSLFLAHFVWSLPFAIVLIAVVLTRFDHRLLDAAEDLGASPWRRLVDIELPLIRPAVVGAGLFGFLLSLSETQRSIFVRGTRTTMPVFQWAQASNQQSYVPISFGLSSIILGLTLAAMLALFLVFRRSRP